MIRLLIGACLAACVLSAQPGAAPEVTVSGQILDEHTTLRNLSVEIRGLADPTVMKHAYVTSMGEFQLSVPSGEYQLVVKDPHGNILKQDLVRIDRNAFRLELRLTSAPSAAPASGSVSLTSLSHKVPGKARRELKSAIDARRRGDTDASFEHVQKALALDPLFAEAHNDLGTEYVNRKQYSRALAEFDRAADLDSGSVIVAMNRAVCLSNLQRLDEAETAARRAVRLDPAAPRARYILGVVLASQKKFTPETSETLISASDAIPQARLLAAQVLVYSGRPADARTQLHRYLDQCSGENCGRVQDWLHRLENAPAPQ